MTGLDIGIVAIVLVASLFIGLLAYRWVGRPDDFYLAGRDVPLFMLVATLCASRISLYTIQSCAGNASPYGISIIWHTWTGDMGMVISALLVMPIYRRIKMVSVPEFLGWRFHPGIRTYVGIMASLRFCYAAGIGVFLIATMTQTLTGVGSFAFWAVLLGAFIIFYTIIGGMWSVVLIDTFQMMLIMLTCLILLPISMAKVGWWSGLVAALPAGHLNLVPSSGPFDWSFILAIWIIGIMWMTSDQFMIQRALGARTVRYAQLGLVITAMVSTAYALVYHLPGLAGAVLYPGVTDPDMVLPNLVRDLLPVGVMGIALAGFMASQVSTVDAQLSSIATVFTHDLWTRMFKKKPSPRTTLFVVRLITLIAGCLVIGQAFLVPYLGGGVRAWITWMGVMDMPLFVAGVVWGFMSRRTNWQGWVAGYTAGVAAGFLVTVVGKGSFYQSIMASGGVSLVVTPLVSLFFRSELSADAKRIFDAIGLRRPKSGDSYGIIPDTVPGRLALGAFGAFTLLFLVAVIAGRWGFNWCGPLSLVGMIGGYVAALTRLLVEK